MIIDTDCMFQTTTALLRGLKLDLSASRKRLWLNRSPVRILLLLLTSASPAWIKSQSADQVVQNRHHRIDCLIYGSHGLPLVSQSIVNASNCYTINVEHQRINQSSPVLWIEINHYYCTHSWDTTKTIPNHSRVVINQPAHREHVNPFSCQTAGRKRATSCER